MESRESKERAKSDRVASSQFLMIVVVLIGVLLLVIGIRMRSRPPVTPPAVPVQ